MSRLVAIVLALLMLAVALPLAGAQESESEEAELEEEVGEEGEEEGTPLEMAQEEAGLLPPPASFEVPAGTVRITSALLAAGNDTFRLSLRLERPVSQGTLDVRLPSKWLRDSAVSDLPFAEVPRTGRAPGSRVDVQRRGSLVRFSFDAARAGQTASFELADVGIPAGTYGLDYRWREPGKASSRGIATTRFYAPVREAGAGSRVALTGSEINVTNDTATESETFVTAVPGNPQRFVVGANGGTSASGFNAWVTNNGTSFTLAAMPATLDAPGEVPPEAGSLCCDPMSAADTAGNIWYGGLSFANGAPNPSRIIVNRIAPGASSFQAQTVGLPVRTGGVQDKPMMTIDNSPTSPTFGRLYVVWDEPSSGVTIVVSTCETRPGGVLNAANCDNADNWTAPVTIFSGSVIYADVAVGPDGKVYVVWWNYSSANAIQGEVCTPPGQDCTLATGWSGAPQTIATLDATSGAPVPFACPILAQPGGRASTSPQVDVDRTGGANNGRVYVTWSDLRTGSGTTRCADGLPPAATHLTFDSFVASAANVLPGSANPSPSVATRLLTDGEGGGQANSDDWFAWLAVDQTNGQAWADFYSTRDDPTRETTNFYVRSVTPSGGTGHTIGELIKVSGAPSDYSNNPCCGFGNDYGDYTGIDATSSEVFAVWSDKRTAADGEAFVFVGSAPLVATPQITDTDPDSPADDNTPQVKGTAEAGATVEIFSTSDCSGAALATGTTAQFASPGLTVTVPGNQTTNLRATATVGADVSACSSPFPYVEDSTAPAAPAITDTDPNSPANDNDPEVKGTAEAGSTVEIYSDSICTGAVLGTGTAAQFAAPGITVNVPGNQTTNLRATATDVPNHLSPCSAPFAYSEDSNPPAVPQISDTDPDSPSADPNPEVKGASDFGTTVRIYAAGACSGAAVGTGSDTQFAAPGITAGLGLGTTTLSAGAFDPAGNASGCSAPFAYEYDTTAPETTITKAPKKKTKGRRARFEFNSNEPGSSFECSLDGKALSRPFARAGSACSSPVSFKVKRGKHKFTVRAVDVAGNAEPQPAKETWKVKKKN